MSKYEPLPDFLDSKKTSHLRLNFHEIEDILGFSLPKSAYRHPAWWSNHAQTHSHARAWVCAGWRTGSVDLAGQKVTFSKINYPLTQGEDGPAGGSGPFGCMADTLTISPEADLTVPAEESWNAEHGRSA